MRTADLEDDAPAGPSAAAALRETRFLLAQLSRAWAAHGCPGTSACCQLQVTGRPPWLWPSEWAVLAAELARTGRPLPPARADGGCPFLDPDGKRCTVYEARPSGCRSYFCHRRTGPAQEPAAATHALLERLASLNLARAPDAAPKPLPEWHADATRGL